MIEEQLAEIARLHPAVGRAIPVRLRTWRRHLLERDTWREFGAFHHAIRQKRYDRIIDAQGLIRSAMLARLAAGPHCGYDRASVREPPASFFYDRRFPVSVTIHAAERMRRLVAQAMGYAPPEEIDYGLDVAGERPPMADRRALSGRPARHRPAGQDLGGGRRGGRWPSEPTRRGSPSCCRGAAEKERQRSLRIAAASPRAIVPPSLGFTEMAVLQAGAAAVVGVDTGLTHLASAVGAPVVAIYAASWSEFNGVIGPAFVANLGGPGAPPDVEAVWAQTEAAVASGRKEGAWSAQAGGAGAGAGGAAALSAVKCPRRCPSPPAPPRGPRPRR